MGRRGQEGIATEAEQIDWEKGRSGHFSQGGLYIEKELIQLLSLWPIRSPKTPHLTVERLHL
jgi:hypothetical protein